MTDQEQAAHVALCAELVQTHKNLEASFRLTGHSELARMHKSMASFTSRHLRKFPEPVVRTSEWIDITPPILLQDSSPTKDGKRLSQWFAAKLDARRRAREAATA